MPPTVDVSTLACVQRLTCGDSTHFDASNMKQVNKMRNEQTVGVHPHALAPNQAYTCDLFEEGPSIAGIDPVPKQEDSQP